MSYTIGLELEWADVDRHATIDPRLGSWNTKDYSIVNSDGHANCPTGKTWRWGGEINTVWSNTSTLQGGIVDVLARQLNPTINYKCNLHVHVAPENPLGVDVIQAVAKYIRANEYFVYHVVDPIKQPVSSDFNTKEELAGAKKRYRRSLTSHHYSLPEERYAELLAAKTLQEAKDAHAPPTWSGARAWHLAPRPGINLRSLWKHGTIEFRHFFGTADRLEAQDAAEWCLRFTRAAILGGPSAGEIYDQREWKFPRARPYDHKLQLGFEATRHRP